VIVPVYNGAATITTCLDALAAQQMAHPYEIIVVDDGSQDATADQVERWMATHPQMRTRLLRQANGGPALARNHGAQVAQSELLLFTDADCVPEPTWAQAFLNAFADPQVVGVKGVYLTRQRALTAQFVQAEYEDRYDRMRGQPTIDFVDTYSAGYRRTIFWENGGFDPAFRMAEDQEFSFRLAQQGHRLVFVPTARVYHLHDESIGEYAWRKFHIGYWKSMIARRHPARLIHDSHTPQVLKVQILLLGGSVGLLPLALLSGRWPQLRRLWPIIGLCAGAFFVSTAPFLAKLRRRSLLLCLSGLWMLPVRGLALGSGFLLGALQPVRKTNLLAKHER
jgi:glycosyltransferase involved in cell wall biosynthesis